MAVPVRYRYPSELATLAATLAITTALVIALSSFTVGGVAIVVALGFVFNLGMVLLGLWRIKRDAVPVAQVPEVAAIVEQCRTRLAITDPIDVYVAKRPVVNAYAIGLKAPYAIVLYTGLIEALDRDELAYVIGHEMGHIQYRHTTILALTGQLGIQTFGVPVLGYFIRYIFLFWMRVSEYTADRAGLVACGRLDKALSTQLKLMVGTTRAANMDVRSIIRHWRDHDVGVAKQLSDVLSTHPGSDARMDKMVDFAHSGAFPELATE